MCSALIFTLLLHLKNVGHWDLPAGPVIETPCFQPRGTGSTPSWGTEIPHAPMVQLKKSVGHRPLVPPSTSCCISGRSGEPLEAGMQTVSQLDAAACIWGSIPPGEGLSPARVLEDHTRLWAGPCTQRVKF